MLWNCDGCGTMSIAATLMFCPGCGEDREMPTTTSSGSSNAWGVEPSNDVPDAVEPAPEPTLTADDEPIDVNGDGIIDDYEKSTVADLSDECKKRGLPSSGTKSDLVKRLHAYDEAHSDVSPS